MSEDLPVLQGRTLVVAADPVTAAATLGPTGDDVDFLSPEEVLARGQRLDLEGVGTVLVAAGAHQVTVLQALLEQGAMPQQLILETDQEWGLAYLEQVQSMRSLLDRVQADGGPKPELAFRAAVAHENRTLIDARVASHTRRQSLPSSGEKNDPSPREAKKAAAPAPPALADRRLKQAQKVSDRRKVRIARLRKRVSSLQAQQAGGSSRDVVRESLALLKRGPVRTPAVTFLAISVIASIAAAWLGMRMLGTVGALVGLSLGLLLALVVIGAILLVVLVRRVGQLRSPDSSDARRRERRQIARLLRQQRQVLGQVVAREEKAATSARETRSGLDSALRALQQAADQQHDLLRRDEDLSVGLHQARGELKSVGAALQSETDQLRMEVRAIEQRANAARVRQTRHLESVVNLYSITPMEGTSPLLGGWAVSADLMAFLVRELVRVRPRTVLECGSGASTLWLALTARRLRIDTRIVTLEHSADFLEETRRTLRDHGVEDLVDLRLAPIEDVVIGDVSTRWYSRRALEGLVDVGLLLVDGPPSTEGPLARYAVVPLLSEVLAARCTVVLDDMVREEEKQVARMWAEGDLAAFELQTLNLEKGAAVFRREPARPEGDLP